MKTYRQVALASKVLVVAVINLKEDRTIFDWTAYIDAVPGIAHTEEYIAVAKFGSKLPRQVAQILFPNLSINKWRA